MATAQVVCFCFCDVTMAKLIRINKLPSSPPPPPPPLHKTLAFSVSISLPLPLFKANAYSSFTFLLAFTGQPKLHTAQNNKTDFPLAPQHKPMFDLLYICALKRCLQSRQILSNRTYWFVRYILFSLCFCLFVFFLVCLFSIFRQVHMR